MLEKCSNFATYCYRKITVAHWPFALRIFYTACLYMDNYTDTQHIKDSFADIAPYDDSQFKDKIKALVQEPGFKNAVRFVMPDVNYDDFVAKILSMKTQREFQEQIMASFLIKLEKSTTSGISVGGLDNIDANKNYTYISNHRDIVLDASFLNLCLLRHNKPLTQIAIGNNLLIYEWISDLVKLNGSFIVKRDVKRLEALKAAKQLSEYIHFTVTQSHQSVWIAQRQGRAKDSNDMTQESLVKMLAIAGGGNAKQNLLQINLLPVSISYEYDPNDYLKVREYLLRSRDEEYKKSQEDDLFSMQTGLLNHKGHVHFQIGKCINEKLFDIDASDRQIVQEACVLIDNEIHKGYKFFPANYIAYDRLEGGRHFAAHYSEKDRLHFLKYMENQLSKINEPNVTEDERRFMEDKFLSMYANPIRNYMKTSNGQK